MLEIGKRRIEGADVSHPGLFFAGQPPGAGAGVGARVLLLALDGACLSSRSPAVRHSEAAKIARVSLIVFIAL